jgi:hypothetical protein
MREGDKPQSIVPVLLSWGSLVGDDSAACVAMGEQQCDKPRYEGLALSFVARSSRLLNPSETAPIRAKR